MDFRSRAQWGATYNPASRELISLPRSLIFIHHNVIPFTSDPNYDMQRTEDADISRFGVPSYKYAVHPSGVALEGMSNHFSPDTINHNGDFSIMFMGNYENDFPTDEAMAAARWIVQLLKAKGWLTPGFRILGHRDVFATACPGAHLYPRIHELMGPVVSSDYDTPYIIIIPSVQEEEGMAVFQFSGQEHVATVDAQGNLIHRWFVIGETTWHKETLATNCIPDTNVGIDLSFNGQLHLYAKKPNNSVAHAWYKPGAAWAAEVLV